MDPLISDNEYTLRFTRAGNVIISRGGCAQATTHEALHQHGVNTLADCARLIERRIRGDLKALAQEVPDDR